MTDEERNLLDVALVNCYRQFGITHNNASLLETKPLATHSRNTRETQPEKKRLPSVKQTTSIFAGKKLHFIR